MCEKCKVDEVTGDSAATSPTSLGPCGRRRPRPIWSCCFCRPRGSLREHLRLTSSPPWWRLAVARSTRGAFPVAAGHRPGNLVRTGNPIRPAGRRPPEANGQQHSDTATNNAGLQNHSGRFRDCADGIVQIQITLRPPSSYTPAPATTARFLPSPVLLETPPRPIASLQRTESVTATPRPFDRSSAPQ
jgi:hypothetical protein